MEDRENKHVVQKREYQAPQLTRYGAVRHWTRTGGTNNQEGVSPGNPSKCANSNKLPCVTGSDVKIKENIVRVGTHPIGVGLYLFDYKPEYRDAWGRGRQFGVMAQEVEKVMPEAVCMHPDGYRVVDYGKLGVSRVKQ